MTRTQTIGVVLIALGLVYALLYAVWLRRRRRHRSAAAVVTSADGGSTPDPSVEVVSAKGTYDGTSEQDGGAVTTAGLAARGPATLLVRRDDAEHLVTIERRGQETVLITAEQLVNARRGQHRQRLSRTRPPLVLTWRHEDTTYETSFVPRSAADLDQVESALWWHGAGSDVRTRPSQPDDHVEPHSSEADQSGSRSPATDSTEPDSNEPNSNEESVRP